MSDSKDITGFFPEPLRGFVSVGAKALGCDEAYVAVPLLGVVAGAIGNARRIRIKQSWSEPSIVWCGIVGESGTVKSPAQEMATRFAWRRQSRILKTHAAERAAYEKARKEWKGVNKEIRGEEPEGPGACEHPVVTDITIEALADRLLATPKGTTLVLDEMGTWLLGFDKYSNGGSEASHWLSLYGGRAMKVDRKTGDVRTIYVPHASVSIIGTIQPAILNEALTPTFYANGLAARLLLVTPPAKAKRWTENEIPDALMREVEGTFDRLYGMQQAQGIDGDAEPVMVDMTQDAREDYATFVNEWNEEIQGVEGHARAAGAKMEGYAARFALIRHCIRQASGEKVSDLIDGSDVGMGVELARWFFERTTETYRLMKETSTGRNRRELREWIAVRGGRVTVRDLQRGMRRYQQGEKAEAALDALANEGYGAWQFVAPGNKGGRPTRLFCLAESPDYPVSQDPDFRNPTDDELEAYRKAGDVSADADKTSETNGNQDGCVNGHANFGGSL